MVVTLTVGNPTHITNESKRAIFTQRGEDQAIRVAIIIYVWDLEEAMEIIESQPFLETLRQFKRT